MNYPATFHITDKSTTTVSTQSETISQIVFLCTGAGTTWALKIKDKPASPKVPRTWFGPVDLTVPSDGKPIIINFTLPVLMEGGIDVITSGGTAGVLDIQII